MRSKLFFAHVRAAAGTAATRANCHPFSAGSMMFMHNGQIGECVRLRRQAESMIPGALYGGRTGTTDAEAMFLTALARGLMGDPTGAIAATQAEVRAASETAGVAAPLRSTAAVTDGRRLSALRWASDGCPASLCWRQDSGGLLVVSEPIDDVRTGWVRTGWVRAGWNAAPSGYAPRSEPGRDLQIRPLDGRALAAA